MKHFTLGILLAAGILSGAAQTSPKIETVFTGTPWSVMGISDNGRYICGTRQYDEAYRYDLQERKLITIATNGSDMAAYDIANDGRIIGTSREAFAGIYNEATDDWDILPLNGDDVTETTAYQCSADGSAIVGIIIHKATEEKPYVVDPVVWRQQSDGTYVVEELPNPRIDFLGGNTQFISPRTISADGNTAVGVMVEEHGQYYTNIVYKRVNGEWTYTLPFVERCYDVDAYHQYMENEPLIEDYVTMGAGEDGYFDAVREFQAAYAQWKYELFTHFRTGKEYGAVPILMSPNGKYLALQGADYTWSFKEGDQDMSVSAVYFPAIYDLETGEMNEMYEVGDFTPWGISNNGDIISDDSANYYYLPKGASHFVMLKDWLKDTYDYDLTAALPSNTEYVECLTLSNDADMFCGVYRSVTPSGELDTKEVFCVLLPDNPYNKLASIDKVEAKRSIYLCDDQLIVNGDATNVQVADLSGHILYKAQKASGAVDLSFLAKGIYIVSANVDNTPIASKIAIK